MVDCGRWIVDGKVPGAMPPNQLSAINDPLLKQNSLQSRKDENEGIRRILSRTRGQAGLILLFDGEVGSTFRTRGREP